MPMVQEICSKIKLAEIDEKRLVCSNLGFGWEEKYQCVCLLGVYFRFNFLVTSSVFSCLSQLRK